MTDYDIAREIRQREIHLRIPIIGMSTENVQDKCIAAGMDDFKQKPFSQDEIAEVLKVFL